MITPHDYQQTAIDKVIKAWQSPLVWKHTTLGIAPTGAGKSIIGLSAFEQYQEAEGRKMRALFVAHTLEIVSTLYKDAVNKYDFDGVGVVNGKTKVYWQQVTIGTVQSLNDDDLLSKMQFFGGVDVLVVDEAHRGVTATHLTVVKKLRKLNPNLRILGLTATYERTDLRGLRELFTHCCFKIQPKQLVKKKRLAKPRVFWPALSHNEPGYVLHKWMQATKGKRKTLIFAESVSHAWEFYDLLDDLGVDVTIVTGDTPAEERDKAMQAHVIVGVDVYKEGANIPGIGCVIVARRSQENPWRQRIGRGLRPDTKDCIILAMDRYKPIKRIPFFVLGIPKPTTLMGQFPSGETFFHRAMSYLSG